MVFAFCEQKEGTLKRVAFETLLVGYKIAEIKNDQLAGIIVGKNIAPLAQEIIKFGVNQAITVDDPLLEFYTPDGYGTVLEQLVRKHQPHTVVLSATALGKDLAATIASRLETSLLPDCTTVEFDTQGTLIAQRPIYAGKALATVKAPEANPLILSIRPRAMPAQTEQMRDGEIITAQLPLHELRTKVAEIVKTVMKTVELTEADVVISGGRGMKGPENYALLEELAAVINAAVGASRAAVDAGWRDHQFQVGQTGKTVSPSLYIACGISGAIQHLVGMMNSKCIVAINKDPEANIFKVADYGIVGDLFQVVPLLTEEFKKAKQS